MARKSQQKAAPKKESPSPAAPIEQIRESVQSMSMVDLLGKHEELCSRKPPQCQRTYDVMRFRAHVIELAGKANQRGEQR